MSNFGRHGNCWDDTIEGNILERRHYFGEDWSPVRWQSRVEMMLWNDQEFYVSGIREQEEGRNIYFVAMVGTAEVRSKYRAKFLFENPKSKKMELLTISEVLPVEALSDKSVVLMSKAFGSVMDTVLKRYMYSDNSTCTSINSIKRIVEIGLW